MSRSLAEQIEFVATHQRRQEAEVLADALRAGLAEIYRDALVQAYLAGEISRTSITEEVGADRLREIDQQRDAFESDLAWGMKRA
jgi:hypothetical protein